MARVGLLIIVLASAIVLQGCESLEKDTRSGIRSTWHKANKADTVLQEYLW